MSEMKKIVIGFLGCGNVGSGVWKLLEGFRDDIAHRCIHVSEEVAKNRKSRCATLTRDLIDALVPVMARPMPGEWYLFGSNQRIEPSAKRVALSNFRKKWDKVPVSILPFLIE